jgi:hypothetical protein
MKPIDFNEQGHLMKLFSDFEVSIWSGYIDISSTLLDAAFGIALGLWPECGPRK